MSGAIGEAAEGGGGGDGTIMAGGAGGGGGGGGGGGEGEGTTARVSPFSCLIFITVASSSSILL